MRNEINGGGGPRNRKKDPTTAKPNSLEMDWRAGERMEGKKWSVSANSLKRQFGLPICCYVIISMANVCVCVRAVETGDGLTLMTTHPVQFRKQMRHWTKAPNISQQNSRTYWRYYNNIYAFCFGTFFSFLSAMAHDGVFFSSLLSCPFVSKWCSHICTFPFEPSPVHFCFYFLRFVITFFCFLSLSLCLPLRLVFLSFLVGYSLSF